MSIVNLVADGHNCSWGSDEVFVSFFCRFISRDRPQNAFISHVRLSDKVFGTTCTEWVWSTKFPDVGITFRCRQHMLFWRQVNFNQSIISGCIILQTIIIARYSKLIGSNIFYRERHILYKILRDVQVDR